MGVGDNVVNNYVAAGLPNITGNTGGIDIPITHANDFGALWTVSKNFSWKNPAGSTQDCHSTLYFDASKSKCIP